MKMVDQEAFIDRWVAVDKTVRDVIKSDLYWEMRQLFNDAEDLFESLRDEIDICLMMRGY